MGVCLDPCDWYCESMGYQWAEVDATHAITPDQKGNPIDVLAGDIFFTYVAHD